MKPNALIVAMKAFIAACKPSKLEKILAARFHARRAHFIAPKANSPLLAAAEMPDPLYYGILGEIVSSLRMRHDIHVQQINTQTLRVGAAQTLRRFIRSRFDSNMFSRRKWRRLYREFCDCTGYDTAAWGAPWYAAILWWRAWTHWRGLQNKDQLSEFTYAGVQVGDLAIDTYLRLRPSVTVNLNDIYLMVVIHRAMKDVDQALAYFSAKRPAVFLSFYSTYIQHGIPVRAALACGITTLTFGNLQEFHKVLRLDDATHTRATTLYREVFESLPGQAEKLLSGENALRQRLSGSIDSATAYMKKSAYTVTSQEIPDVRGAAVIFLHDFYDSVHIYSWILFHDFWEWLCFTIETLLAVNQDFWIKPHPNQGAKSSAEIARLREKYPNAKFLSSEITNRQLVDAGIVCAITVYGSVASEVAFMGIPSISSGDSPYASFSSFQVARTRDEYRHLLRKIATLKPDVERLKVDAAACYYMHNLDLDDADIELRDKFGQVFTHLSSLETGNDPDEGKIGEILSAMTDTAGFARFADLLFIPN